MTDTVQNPSLFIDLSYN